MSTCNTKIPAKSLSFCKTCCSNPKTYTTIKMRKYKDVIGVFYKPELIIKCSNCNKP